MKFIIKPKSFTKSYFRVIKSESDKMSEEDKMILKIDELFEFLSTNNFITKRYEVPKLK
jgi:hypothetical protein